MTSSMSKKYWSQGDKVWINVIIDLFAKLFGKDFLDYVYTTDHGTVVVAHSDPRNSFSYDHELWEATYQATCQEQSIKKPISASDSVKQLATGTSAASKVNTTGLDDITLLEKDPLPQVSDKPPQNEKSAPVADANQTAIQCKRIPFLRHWSVAISQSNHLHLRVCFPLQPPCKPRWLRSMLFQMVTSQKPRLHVGLIYNMVCH